MAALDLFRTPSVTSSARYIYQFTNLFIALRDWNDTRLTRKALSALTDRELQDIGLQRCDIDGITRL